MVHSTEIGFSKSPGLKVWLLSGFVLMTLNLSAQALTFERLSSELGLSQNMVTALFQDQQGFLWVGTRGGLNRFDGYQFKVYRYDPFDTLSISNNTITDIHEDQQGRLWINTDNGLNLFDREKEAFYRVPNGQTPADKFSPDPIPAPVAVGEHPGPLLRSHQGEFFRLADQQIFNWDSHQKIWRSYPVKKGKNLDLRTYKTAHTSSSIVFRDKSGWIWISGSGPTFSYNTLTEELRMIGSNTDPDNLFFYGLEEILEDQGGLIWLGTRGQGLLKFNRFARRFESAGNEESPKENRSVRSIYKTSDGMLCIGYVIEGCSFMGGENRKTEFPNSGVITSFQEDQTGNLWICSKGVGLIRVSGWKTGAIKRETYDMNPGPKTGDESSDPTSIVMDKDRRIWMACPDALRLFDPKTEKTEVFPFFNGDLGKAFNNQFPVLIQDRAGILWIGLTEGLWRFDPTERTFKKYQNDPKNPKTLSYDLVKSIAEAPDQPDRYLWIGTGGGGLNRFDKTSGLFEKWTEKDGLPDLVVYGILPDEKGSLWLSTNKGISVFNPKSQTFRNFDTRDGLQDMEFNTCAYFKAADGQLFFGGIKGYNAFYPKNMLESNRHAPTIVFTDFKISNKSVSVKDPNSVLNSAIAYCKKIVLNPDVKVISFEFAALDFSDPNKHKFTCLMEGFNSEWQQLGTNHSVTYTNLAPGTYNFRVKGTNNDGVWSETDAVIQIVILAPWWATWWAYTLYALLTGGILFAFVFLLNKRNQDKAEAHRLKKLNEAKNTFLSTVSHELRTPLTSIMGFSKIIKKRLEERIFPNLQTQDPKVAHTAGQIMENLDIVVHESERLTTLINAVLDLAKIEAGKVAWNETPLQMRNIIELAVGATATLFESKKIQVITKTEPQLPLVNADHDRMMQVVVNLLSNAAKFTDTGTVTCTASRLDERHIVVRIQDSGIGIAEKDLHLVFEKFTQLGEDTLTDKPQGTGLGLPICKEIIEHYGGKIWVESKVGKGSTFSFSLPIEDDVLAGRELEGV